MRKTVSLDGKSRYSIFCELRVTQEELEELEHLVTTLSPQRSIERVLFNGLKNGDLFDWIYNLYTIKKIIEKQEYKENGNDIF